MSYEERNGVLYPPPFHGWFDLSYCSYLVVPRTLLEALPHDLQERMIQCLHEMSEVFDDDRRYAVFVRGAEGKFIKDALCNYRYPPNLAPWRRPERARQG